MQQTGAAPQTCTRAAFGRAKFACGSVYQRRMNTGGARRKRLLLSRHPGDAECLHYGDPIGRRDVVVIAADRQSCWAKGHSLRRRLQRRSGEIRSNC